MNITKKKFVYRFQKWVHIGGGVSLKAFVTTLYRVLVTGKAGLKTPSLF